MAPNSGQNFGCTWGDCSKAFNRKSDLCRHYRIHTNERPYQCQVTDCNKSFIQRSALVVHSRTHTGEKPHFCNYEGCPKAFSDSSSLARHRRIHTGTRPYICQRPACERSFCRKTTLTKHERRSHPPGTMDRTFSEDATSENSRHQTPLAVPAPMPNDQYILTQQPSYPHWTTPSHEFYSPQGVPMWAVLVHEAAPPIVAQSIPVSSPMRMQHQQHHHYHQQQQQYIQQILQQQQQQQRYDTNPRTDYIPTEYQQQPYSVHQMPQEQPVMVSYHSNYAYKLPDPGRINQLERTDWGFLGIG